MSKWKNVRFTKIENNHNRLRDDIIEGITYELPRVGHQFKLVGVSRDGDAFKRRLVETNFVKSIESSDSGIVFTTMSGSTYKVEVLDDQ